MDYNHEIGNLRMSDPVLMHSLQTDDEKLEIMSQSLMVATQRLTAMGQRLRTAASDLQSAAQKVQTAVQDLQTDQDMEKGGEHICGLPRTGRTEQR